jgi:hypothetical protein
MSFKRRVLMSHAGKSISFLSVVIRKQWWWFPFPTRSYWIRHLVRSLLVLMTDNWRFFIMIKHESTAWGMMFHSARLSVICQSDCFLWFAMHMAVVCGFSCLLSCLCPVLLHGKTFKLFCFPSFDFERAWWRLIQKLVECTKFDIFVLANSFQMCLVRFKTDYFDGQAWHRCSPNVVRLTRVVP